MAYALSKPRQCMTSSGRPPALLCFLGLLCLGLEAFGFIFHRKGQILPLVLVILSSAIPFALAAYYVTRAKILPHGSLTVILLFGVLMRIALVPLDPPYLSTDIYRYIWDARVQASGVSPYDYVPADPNLRHLRDADIYQKINRKDYAHTIYPPAAQIAFFAISRFGESVLAMKAGIAVCDLTTIGILLILLRTLNQPLERVILYAWHPLVVWEFGSAGHVDAIMILFIVTAFLFRVQNRPGLSGASLACATLVKFLPILLIPALYKRWTLRMPAAFVATIGLLYLPCLLHSHSSVLGFLPEYASEEGFTGGQRFYLLDLCNHLLHFIRLHLTVPASSFVGLMLVTVAGISVWAQCRKSNAWLHRGTSEYLLSGLVLSVVASVLISSNYPWYYAWIIPFLCFVDFSPALLLTLAVPVFYRSISEYLPLANFKFHSQVFLPFFGVFALWFYSLRKTVLQTPQLAAVPEG
jgi:alpha-1,6-mannosyltransferase